MAARAAAIWAGATGGADDYRVDAAALNLHGFYAGLERVFVVIAERVDGSVPGGANWHQELLRQMAVELPGVRPAVLTPELAARLEPFRGFRHVVRNVYARLLTRRASARSSVSWRTRGRPSGLASRSSPAPWTPSPATDA